jgi:hypothetical protein
MKNLSTKTATIVTSESNLYTKYFSIFAFIFFLLSFVFVSNSSAIQQKGRKDEPPKDKRYDLLEKLEKGASISSEDISSSLGNFNADHYTVDEHSMSDVTDLEIPPLPPFPSFHNHSYFWHNDSDDQFIINDKDVAEIHRHLNKSMEELKRDIESFHHSDEFRKFQEELQNWKEDFRKELDKMKVEWNEQKKETRSKNFSHEIM